MRIFLALIMFVFLSGCLSMQPIGKGLSNEQVYHKIIPGDELIVELKSQEKIKIIVTKVTAEQIEADGQIYKFDDIEEIQKQGVSIWKTTGAVIGTLYLLGFIAALVILG
ncbi:hypothetical protein FLL45_13340 [Aliikangiella marina]|uniref:Uncharacterized protein n=1 Tax=Aliikangiella marina TaxID=1712262 RepID=A0A545T9G5_9GAMM|nr:hypothetical protein [Aliikangiella marina]TQV73847.1 hypothetical protein FLL45_13340 [Aliikangiella marina]